jgi:conjugal transfer pilus assembly protein TrbC
MQTRSCIAVATALVVAAAIHCSTAWAQRAQPTVPRMPTQAELDAAIPEQRRALPNVEPSSVDPSRQPALDLSDLAGQYERLRRGPGADGGASEGTERQASGLVVFASLGMPRATLDRLIADAERAPALLVLRGMVGGSLRKTAERIQELLGQRKVAWQIDPTLFTRFNVQVVPSFVLIDPARPVQVVCRASTCTESAYSRVTGDVSIGYALATIERLDPEFAALASRYAFRLGGGR